MRRDRKASEEFNPKQKFICRKEFRGDGRSYKNGDVFQVSVIDVRRLRKLYNAGFIVTEAEWEATFREIGGKAEITENNVEITEVVSPEGWIVMESADDNTGSETDSGQDNNDSAEVVESGSESNAEGEDKSTEEASEASEGDGNPLTPETPAKEEAPAKPKGRGRKSTANKDK